MSRERKRKRGTAGIDGASSSETRMFDTEEFGLSEEQVPSQGSSPKSVRAEPSTEEQKAAAESPPWVPPEPSTEEQANHPFRPPDGFHVIMTEADEGPKPSQAEFLKKQRERVARMRNSKRELVNLSKISTEHVSEAFEKCNSCR